MKKLALVAFAAMMLIGQAAGTAQAKVSEEEIMAGQAELLDFLADELVDETPEEIFQEFDRNRDGSVTLAEFKKGAKQEQLILKASVMKAIFTDFEAIGGNGNKKLTFAEFTNALSILLP